MRAARTMLALEDEEGDYVPTPAEALGATLAAPAAAGAATSNGSIAFIKCHCEVRLIDIVSSQIF